MTIPSTRKSAAGWLGGVEWGRVVARELMISFLSPEIVLELPHGFFPLVLLGEDTADSVGDPDFSVISLFSSPPQIELAILRFPYDSWGTPFQQLKQVVEEPSPQLPADKFSEEFVDFTSQW